MNILAIRGAIFQSLRKGGKINNSQQYKLLEVWIMNIPLQLQIIPRFLTSSVSVSPALGASNQAGI
jgi:hypothetical protein